MLSDQHMHSRFSTDSEADPRAMADRAIELGIRRICFTDHHDIGFPEEGKYLLDVGPYRETMGRLREEYRGRLEIGIGVELGLMPSTGAETAAFAAAWPFDFVIGSLHVLDGKDPYYRDDFAAYTDAALYRLYFEELADSIRASEGFHALGHLDYIVRYGYHREEEYSIADNADILDAILRDLVARGIALEVNTGGLRKQMAFPNPHPDILRRYRELGGELVTAGADAHRPSDVGHAFAAVRDILLDAGFRYIAEFEEGRPRMVKVE